MTDEYDERIFSCLPGGVCREIGRIAADNADFLEGLSEIRLRAGRYAAVTLRGRNLLLSHTVTEEDLSATFRALVGHSLYRHRESLAEGYFTVHGFRVSVGGRAVFEKGAVVGMGEISSLCIRVPHDVRGAGQIGVELFSSLERRRGFLVYSAPGVGKTTFLRDLAESLSCGRNAMRVVLVDVRGELCSREHRPACQIDLLSGYPMARGIEIATRTLSPEVIICDEIGSLEEAEAVLSVMGGGVPVIASAHAGDLRELLSRGPIRLLHERSAFGAYVGIARKGDGYTYRIDREEESGPVCSESLFSFDRKE